MSTVILFLLGIGALFGQDTPLDRLKREAEHVRSTAARSSQSHVESVAGLHAALRDWIESRLPADKGSLAATLFSHIESAMEADLQAAGLTNPQENGAADGDFGYVDLKFTLLPELPDAIFVTAGATVPCGVDEAVYMYRFNAAGWRREFEDHPKSKWGYSFANLQISDPDPQGRRLLLTHYLSVQCASMWMRAAYSVYRLAADGVAQKVFSDDQGIYLGNDELEYVLKPDALIVEFDDRSVDSGILVRTHIRRYEFVEAAGRLDPVAFMPQDFAEEWLTRPWSEMESRSAPDTAGWHSKLHADFILADYEAVVPCAERPGRWMIGLNITHIGEKELPTALKTYFLVREYGSYRYEMETVSATRPQGCPGTAYASDKHPWLSEAELKALP